MSTRGARGTAIFLRTSPMILILFDVRWIAVHWQQSTGLRAGAIIAMAMFAFVLSILLLRAPLTTSDQAQFTANTRLAIAAGVVVVVSRVFAGEYWTAALWRLPTMFGLAFMHTIRIGTAQRS